MNQTDSARPGGHLINTGRSTGLAKPLQSAPSRPDVRRAGTNRGTMRLGRIQRRIRLALVGHPGREFYTSDLAKYAYPTLKGPLERKHRWAICRAAERVGYKVRRDWPGGVVWVGSRRT